MTLWNRAMRAIDPWIALMSPLFFVLGFAVLLWCMDRKNLPGMVAGLALAFIGHVATSQRQIEALQRRINRLETEQTARSEDSEQP